MNWYIYVFLSSAVTDIPEPNIRANDLSTSTAIMTCTPESERVALEKRRKIAPHKSVLAAFYTPIQSLNKMTFTGAALGRNGKTIVFPFKDPELGDYVIVALSRKHIVMH